MSQIVKKSNFLIPLRETLSKPAQLLASFLVACVNQRGRIADEMNGLPIMEFSYREIKNALNADGKARVSKVDDVFNLGIELQRAILFYENEKSKRTVTWIIQQDLQDKQFVYTLHPALKQYLVSLKSEFTTYLYYCRVCLNSNAMKLYEILKMFEFRGKVELDIEEDIKRPLGLSKRYEKYYELRRWVIDVAQAEFLQYTDIAFTYKPKRKKGKKVLSLEFTITANTPTDLPEALLEAVENYKNTKHLTIPSKTKKGQKTNTVSKKDYPELYKDLEKWGGKETAIANLIKKHGAEKIRYYITYTKRQVKEGKVNGAPFGYFRSGLQQNWTDPVQEKQKKSAAKRQAFKDKKAKISLLETERGNIIDAYFNKRRKIATDFFTENRKTLHELFETLKGMEHYATRCDGLFKNKGQSVSAEEAYKDKLFGWGVMMPEFHKQRPDLFKDLVHTYRAKVEAIDIQLVALNVKPTVVNWGELPIVTSKPLQTITDKQKQSDIEALGNLLKR